MQYYGRASIKHYFSGIFGNSQEISPCAFQGLLRTVYITKAFNIQQSINNNTHYASLSA